MMSNPGNFLPPAVKKEIKARTLSGNPFSVEELDALISSLLQERFQKDEKKIVKKKRYIKSVGSPRRRGCRCRHPAQRKSGNHCLCW
jgi:hypothetical protein